jgi:hypothetical protein
MTPCAVGDAVRIVGDCDSADATPTSPSIAFASPKSSTFTVPLGAMRMLPGLRSRCTTP